jgi:transcription antitermination factor NusG
MTSTFSTPSHPPGSANPVTHWYACRTRARAEKQVCRFLERVGVENGSPAPIREVEMESVRRFVMGVEGRGETPAPEDWWEPGTQILVRQGPFRGMKGYLLESRGKRRVAVKLDALKMAFSVEMDLEELERVA